MAAVSRAFNACDGCGPPLPPLGDFCTGKRAMAERDWPATDRDRTYGDAFGEVGLKECPRRLQQGCIHWGWLNPDGSKLPGADRWKESCRSLKTKKMRERKVEKKQHKKIWLPNGNMGF
ncbi:hypothetical protein AOLI_G00021560 [Acnodon oligacanthus]